MTEEDFDPNKQAAWAIMQAGHVEETERMILQAIFHKPDNFPMLYSMGLREHHFTTDPTRFIFSVADSIFQSRGFVDYGSIQAEIKEKGAIGMAGGEDFIISLWGLEYNQRGLPDYVSRLIEARQLKEGQDTVRDYMFRMGDVAGLSIREQLQLFREFQHEMMNMQSEAQSTMHDADRVAQVVADVMRDAIEGKQIARQETGIKSLDNITGGLPESRVTILAARTSHGKTSFGMWLSIKQNQYWRSIGERGQVLYFSGEMSAQAMGVRYLSSMSGVNASRLSMGSLTGIDRSDAEPHVPRFQEEIRISIDEHSSPTSAYMMSAATTLHAIEPVRLVIFDYIEYTGEKARTRDLELDKAMTGCHELAKRLGCPVVVLSQVSRAAVKDLPYQQPPALHHLRHSGSIEQKASMVAMLHHEWMAWKQTASSDMEPDPFKYTVAIRKNTMGPVGDLQLEFDRSTTSFTDPLDRSAQASMRIAA